jgi:xeroderma pigmentosum group C-complementing protein
VNEFGNIEICDGDLWFVPQGAEYVDGTEAIKVAKSLNIEFAPAVTTFEYHGGRPCPKVTGIVVCKRHVQMIKDGMVEVIAHKEELADKRYKKEIYNRWNKIVRLVLSRQRLKVTYGH